MQPFDSARARERIATLQQFNSFRVVAAGHGGVEGTAALADQTMPKFGDDPLLQPLKNITRTARACGTRLSDAQRCIIVTLRLQVANPWPGIRRGE